MVRRRSAVQIRAWAPTMRSPRTILLILIPLVLLGVIFYISIKKADAPDEETQSSYLVPEGSSNERGESKEERLVGSDTGQENQERIKTMEYIAEHISRFSPVQPVLGGKWFAVRFWFVDDTNFYVEYEDGHIMRKLLLKGKDTDYTVVGHFEPGENDWNLIEGKDPYFGIPLDLYEYSEQKGKWVKKN